MSPPTNPRTLPPITTDLTRWNRAGLARFSYVDANAATHLEAIRAALAQRFGQDWARVGPLTVDDDGAAATAALLERYTAESGDAGWELIRAVARAMHVISAHVDAYAGEAFLGTATQIESVRRIVSLLGYHPAGASSASTTVTFDATAAEVVVPDGTGVKHTPADGRPIRFETRHPLTAHLALNALVHVDADRNPQGLTNPLPLAEDVPVVIGAPVVLEALGDLTVHTVTSVSRDDDDLPTVLLDPTPDPGWALGDTVVHTNPRDRLEALGPVAEEVGTTGPPHVLRLAEAPAGIDVDDVVFVHHGRDTEYAVVDGVGPNDLTLETAHQNLPVDTVVGRATEAAVYDHDTNTVSLPGDWRWLEGRAVALREQQRYRADAHPRQTTTFIVTNVRYIEDVPVGEPARTSLALDASAIGFTPATAHVKPTGAEDTAIAVDSPLADASGGLPTALTSSAASETVNGDLVVLADGADAAVARAQSVVGQADGTTELATSPWLGSGRFHTATTTLYGHFADITRPRRWDRNATPLGGDKQLLLRTGDQSVGLSDVADSLAPGRVVVLDVDPVAHELLGADPPVVVPAVSSVERVLTRPRSGTPHAVQVDLTVPVPAGVTVSTLVVRANAVQTSHGETRDEIVLGSGDASRTFQAFTVPVTGVSHPPDPMFPTGFAAAVRVFVDGREWTQVESLQDSAADARHFTVRLDADGQPVVAFGDDRTGRRLPTGRDNVRARYRIGAGLVGNVPAASSVELPSKLDGVDRVRQPLAASGGGDGERVEDVRVNAPRATLALGRAVSLADYAALAARRADVWQATSRRGVGRRGVDEVIEISVVPAGGGGLSVPQRDAIQASLLAAAPPGVQVDVRPFLLLPVTVAVTVHVDPAAFELETVRLAVDVLLAARLSVEQRRLGDPLSRAEVLRDVESVVGVETATAAIDLSATAATAAAGVDVGTAGWVDGDGRMRMLRADADQLIALRTDPPGLTVLATEFRP